jgi:hypothetical protein
MLLQVGQTRWGGQSGLHDRCGGCIEGRIGGRQGDLQSNMVGVTIWTFGVAARDSSVCSPKSYSGDLALATKTGKCGADGGPGRR